MSSDDKPVAPEQKNEATRPPADPADPPVVRVERRDPTRPVLGTRDRPERRPPEDGPD